MQSKLTDKELIAQILSGNQLAYTYLIARYQRFVFTLALRCTKNWEDAEEITQDCFVKAYHALASFQQKSKFSTWLYSIAYTTAMSFLRKKQVATISIDDDSNAVQIENNTAGIYPDNVETKSRSFYLNLAIAQLIPDDAAIITLFYKGEQSLQEIAQTMDLEVNTVKVKLFRGRQRLKEKLESILKHEAKELI